MIQTVEAVYENGVFKPLKKIKLPEHECFKLNIIPIEEDDNEIKQVVEKQKKALKKFIGIGRSGLSDVSENHDKYLYKKD